jgi:hypothetical protein
MLHVLASSGIRYSQNNQTLRTLDTMRIHLDIHEMKFNETVLCVGISFPENMERLSPLGHDAHSKEIRLRREEL